MTFYIYDLETSGVNPREQRIMQFAGIRVNEKLEEIGDLDDIIVKLSEDVLPDPWAILTHGITPQKSVSEGVTEAEFLKWFDKNVAQPSTVIFGYNSIRFDDEFMRYALYRNYYDPYEWQWRDNRSKWDLMDVVRMTRALRPGKINWPFASSGKPSVSLELMASANNIKHVDAHTAGSDVMATLELARLIRKNSPKLFDYLLSMRDKKNVAKLTSAGTPFVYTSGRYQSEFEKTTVAVSLGDHPEQSGSLLVYDLRYDPEDFADLSAQDLQKRIFVPKDSDLKKLPVKAMALNKCPAVAPLGVVDKEAWKRIGLDLKTVETNLKHLSSSDLAPKVRDAFSINHKARQEVFLSEESTVDAQLYDGFFNDGDKLKSVSVRNSKKQELADLDPGFTDTRLDSLLPLYKARNYPDILDSGERESWHRHLSNKFYGGAKPRVESFAKDFETAKEAVAADKNKLYLLEELQLYVQSILPEKD